MSYSDAFLRAVHFTLEWEGGYDNDPDDLGGETNFGIDKRSHPDVDIKHLTREGAIEIYHRDYWLPMRGDEFSPNLAAVLFDIAVNNGKGRAVKWLQQFVGATVDGALGAQTIAATRWHNQGELATALLNRRESFYRDIANGRMAKFLGGWLNRNNALRKLVTPA